MANRATPRPGRAGWDIQTCHPVAALHRSPVATARRRRRGNASRARRRPCTEGALPRPTPPAARSCPNPPSLRRRKPLWARPTSRPPGPAARSPSHPRRELRTGRGGWIRRLFPRSRRHADRERTHPRIPIPSRVSSAPGDRHRRSPDDARSPPEPGHCPRPQASSRPVA